MMNAELTAENRPAYNIETAFLLRTKVKEAVTPTNIRSTSISPLCLSRNSSSCCFATRSYVDQKREGASCLILGKMSDSCIVSRISWRMVSDLDVDSSIRMELKPRGTYGFSGFRGDSWVESGFSGPVECPAMVGVEVDV